MWRGFGEGRKNEGMEMEEHVSNWLTIKGPYTVIHRYLDSSLSPGYFSVLSDVEIAGDDCNLLLTAEMKVFIFLFMTRIIFLYKKFFNLCLPAIFV